MPVRVPIWMDGAGASATGPIFPAPRSPLPAPPMTRQRLLDLSALHRRRGRDAQGAFLVEGVRSVEAAVAAGAPLLEVVVADDVANDARVAALVAGTEAPVSVVPARDVERISDARTSQGVVAVARRIVRPDAGGLAAARRVLVLDGVQDPGNVGALVRSAAWFGLDAVVADMHSADPEGPKAVRAAMGGLWDLALVRCDLDEALGVLAGAGLALWGADLGGADARAWSPPARCALVYGQRGARPLRLRHGAPRRPRLDLPQPPTWRLVEHLGAGAWRGVAQRGRRRRRADGPVGCGRR